MFDLLYLKLKRSETRPPPAKIEQLNELGMKCIQATKLALKFFPDDPKEIVAYALEQERSDEECAEHFYEIQIKLMIRVAAKAEKICYSQDREA